MEILQHTPRWVYILLIYLLWIGFRATKPRIVPLRKLFIIPLLFTAMSLHSLLSHFQISIITISSFSIAILLGSLGGFLLVYHHDIKIDKVKGLVHIGGTWSTLIVIIIIFMSKYYLGYRLGTSPNSVNNSRFVITMLSISGLCSGLFIGRLIAYLNHWRTT